MAMNLDTAIKFTAKLEGTGLDQLKRGLQGLAQQGNVSKRTLDQLYTATKVLGSASKNTVAGLERTVGALKSLRDNAEFGSRKFKLLSNDIQAAEVRLRKFQGAASASGGLSRGSTLMAGFAGGVAGSLTTMAASGAMNAAGGIVQAGLSAETAQVRLKALTQEFGEYNAAQESATRIAQTLRISQTEAEDSFSQLYAALRPTGVTLKEVEDAFIGFTAAARASGATSIESAAALQQLKQALGSGVLQGDELRSIKEQAPAVGQAIAKEMGVTVGELKKLGSEGKITTDVVLRALARLKGEKLDDLNAQFNTGTQALKDLQIAAENVGKSISRIFGPTALKVVKEFAGGLQDVANVLGSLSGDKGAEAIIQDRIRAREQAQTDTGNRPFGLFDVAGKQTFFQQRQEQLFQQFQRDRANAPSSDKPTATQQRAKDDAEQARQQARDRAKNDAAKKRLDDEIKIRQDAEKRLADFREQSIQRAAQLERDLGEQRQELERSTAEARRRIAAQQQEFALEAERQKLRGAGLGTEALDTQARLNEATRRFTEQKIQIEQSATDKRVQIERTLADYQLSVARGISEILQDAADKMAKKMTAGGQAAAAAMTGAPMAPGGIIARTGNTGQSTGPHLDARFSDGRRITAADADRYLSVNGRAPSSYGVTSGYGPRSMFGRNFHAGMDFGTPSGSGITLKSGASVLRDLGFTGAGGYAIEIDTPDGRMRLLHLQKGSVNARPVGNARQLIGRPSAVVGAAGVNAAGQRLDAAVGANRSTGLAAAAGDLVSSRQTELGTITSQLDQQRKSVREQREDFERMVELQRSGLSPELARQAVDRERVATSEASSLQVLEQQLVKDLESKDLTVQQRADVEAILKSTQDRLAAQPGIVAALTDEEHVLARLQQAYDRQKELAQGIAGVIGQGIGSSLDLLIDGTDNWGESLSNIAATVLKDIARQLLQIMVIAPIVESIKNGLSPGGGIAKFFGFANGGIMTGDGPMPLKKYASGGIANSPQLAMFGEGRRPEAFVPLPDGRRIPVAMQGGGGGSTNVTVNVDASGNASVQGDQSQAKQLGVAVSAAVQAELVKQQRPGGILAGTRR
jgi:tape measure domain-containing protein